MWKMFLKTRLFVHFKPQIKKNWNPGTRALKLKNLTRPKAQKPGYPGSEHYLQLWLGESSPGVQTMCKIGIVCVNCFYIFYSFKMKKKYLINQSHKKSKSQFIFAELIIIYII